MNHTLFFMNLGGIGEVGENGYIFQNDFVVFDEAHTIEQAAARQIGMAISQYDLRRALHRLYNPKTKKGLLQALRRPQQITSVAGLLEISEQFFTHVGERIDFGKSREHRVRAPDFVDDTLSGPLAELQSAVVKIIRELEDETLKAELQDLGRRIRDARGALGAFLKQDQDDHVYWIEQTGKTQKYYSLNAVPIDMAGHLNALLFRPRQSCIMTSATLSTGGAGLDYFRNRVGAYEVESRQIGSPFDFERQMKLYITKKMPDP